MGAAVLVAPAIFQPLDARYRAGRRYELVSPFEYQSGIATIGRFIIPAHFFTNFHSTPRITWPIFPPDDYAEGAVGHDFAYRFGGVLDYQAPPEVVDSFFEDASDAAFMYALRRDAHWRDVDRLAADRLHRELLVHCGSSQARADAMFVGLRVGGWKSWRDYRNGRRQHLEAIGAA
jgi:hypothetical protein